MFNIFKSNTNNYKLKLITGIIYLGLGLSAYSKQNIQIKRAIIYGNMIYTQTGYAEFQDKENLREQPYFLIKWYNMELDNTYLIGWKNTSDRLYKYNIVSPSIYRNTVNTPYFNPFNYYSLSDNKICNDLNLSI